MNFVFELEAGQDTGDWVIGCANFKPSQAEPNCHQGKPLMSLSLAQKSTCLLLSSLFISSHLTNESSIVWPCWMVNAKSIILPPLLWWVRALNFPSPCFSITVPISRSMVLGLTWFMLKWSWWCIRAQTTVTEFCQVSTKIRFNLIGYNMNLVQQYIEPGHKPA